MCFLGLDKQTNKYEFEDFTIHGFVWNKKG